MLDFFLGTMALCRGGKERKGRKYKAGPLLLYRTLLVVEYCTNPFSLALGIVPYTYLLAYLRRGI